MLMEDITTTRDKKRIRDDSDESEFHSPEAKRIRDDLLDILDDSELAGFDRDPSTQDLASVMKSFEEEISLPPPPPPPLLASISSVSDESLPDLGYLLEASDDELGLPPAVSPSGEEEKKSEEVESLRVSSDTIGFDQIWRFEDEIPSYEFVIGEEKENTSNNAEYVALEGLFDFSDEFSGQSDFSEFSWRPETLPAL